MVALGLCQFHSKLLKLGYLANEPDRRQVPRVHSELTSQTVQLAVHGRIPVFLNPVSCRFRKDDS